MSFLAELHQLPAMSALSSDARRRFVLADVTSGGDLAVTARERQMGEKAAASLLEQSDIRAAIVDVAYAYALRLQAIVISPHCAECSMKSTRLRLPAETVDDLSILVAIGVDAARPVPMPPQPR